eukprot:scaffold174190_cov17-Tisochrysis_lutea.AAC.1
MASLETTQFKNQEVHICLSPIHKRCAVCKHANATAGKTPAGAERTHTTKTLLFPLAPWG